MDILLLGLAALVLIALTLWIVWRPASTTVQPQQEAAPMLPQGDSFEDQYTSATADLSAGGVAISTASFETPPPQPAPTDSPIPLGPGRPPAALPEPSLPTHRRALNVGAAALLTLGGAISGAFLYSRWQKQRNKPLGRLRRRLR
jgi:hypothetical protein